MRYHNYHKHDDYSNLRINDVCVSPEAYMKRSIELGHTTYFTTNHGCSSNVFEAYDLCERYGLKCIFGMECYFVYDRFQKDKSNWHIVIIALNKKGYKELNYINSIANENGFYYQPRIDMDLLSMLTPENVVITTACINNPIFMPKTNIDGVINYLLPLKEKFGDHLFLELQNHNVEKQKKWNEQAIQLSEKYDIKIIHANDSHYIRPEDAKVRQEYLKGKGFGYSDEDEFILDYPDTDEIFYRYRKQGILTDEQIKTAIDNTLIFDKAESLDFTKDIKMPTIDHDLTVEQRYQKLVDILNPLWKEYITKIPDKEERKRRYQGVKDELAVIKNTNDEIHIADYFLVNNAIIDRGINEYGGFITRTGRGSAVSYFINYLLGFTKIDRFEADVPLYPSRFISSARLLQSKSLPDELIVPLYGNIYRKPSEPVNTGCAVDSVLTVEISSETIPC